MAWAPLALQQECFPRRGIAAVSRFLTLAAAAILVSGCCSGVTTDPRRGGLQGGVCGQVTGAYEARLDERRARLLGIEGATQRLENSLSGNRDEAAGLERRIAARRKATDADQREVANVRSEIETVRRQNALSRAERRAVEAEIAELDGELAGLVTEASRRAQAARAVQGGYANAEQRRRLETESADVDRRLQLREARLRALREKLR